MLGSSFLIGLTLNARQWYKKSISLLIQNFANNTDTGMQAVSCPVITYMSICLQDIGVVAHWSLCHNLCIQLQKRLD